MRILESDVPRNFAIGFVLGALIVAFQINPDIAGSLVPEVIARTL